MSNNNDVVSIDANLFNKIISYLEIERAELKQQIKKKYMCDELFRELVGVVDII